MTAEELIEKHGSAVEAMINLSEMQWTLLSIFQSGRLLALLGKELANAEKARR